MNREQIDAVLDAELPFTYDQKAQLAARVFDMVTGLKAKKSELVAAANDLVAVGQRIGTLSGTEGDGSWDAIVRGFTKAELVETFQPIAEDIRAVTSREADERWRLRSALSYPEINEKAIADLEQWFGLWAEKLKANPLYELGWSTKAFSAAAELQWRKNLQYAIDQNVVKGGQPIQQALGRFAFSLQETLVRGARNIMSRSTSQVANLSDDAEFEARAKLLEDLRLRARVEPTARNEQNQ